MSDNESEKWGWHKRYGWIVIDLAIAGNNCGDHKFRYLIQCKNWTVRKIPTLDTRPPEFTYADKFLESLSEEEALQEAAWLKAYKSKFPEKRANARKEAIKKLHENYLEVSKVQLGSVNSASPTFTKKRVARNMHCWQCKHNLDKLLNPICSSCGWYICDSCGACRCGSPYS